MLYEIAPVVRWGISDSFGTCPRALVELEALFGSRKRLNVKCR